MYLRWNFIPIIPSKLISGSCPGTKSKQRETQWVGLQSISSWKCHLDHLYLHKWLRQLFSFNYTVLWEVSDVVWQVQAEDHVVLESIKSQGQYLHVSRMQLGSQSVYSHRFHMFICLHRRFASSLLCQSLCHSLHYNFIVCHTQQSFSGSLKWFPMSMTM